MCSSLLKVVSAIFIHEIAYQSYWRPWAIYFHIFWHVRHTLPMLGCVYMENSSNQWVESQMCSLQSHHLWWYTQYGWQYVCLSSYSFLLGLSIVTSSITVDIWKYSWLSFISVNHGMFAIDFRILFWYPCKISMLNWLLIVYVLVLPCRLLVYFPEIL